MTCWSWEIIDLFEEAGIEWILLIQRPSNAGIMMA